MQLDIGIFGLLSLINFVICKLIINHNLNNWPIVSTSLYSEIDEQLGEDFIEILNQVRKIKANAQLSVKYQIHKLIINSENYNFPTSLENDLKAVCNAEHIIHVLFFILLELLYTSTHYNMSNKQNM